MVPLYVCVRCRIREGGHAAVLRAPRATRMRRRLTLAYQHIDARTQRASSLKSVRRALQDYRKYADVLQEEALPATPFY